MSSSVTRFGGEDPLRGLNFRLGGLAGGRGPGRLGRLFASCGRRPLLASMRFTVPGPQLDTSDRCGGATAWMCAMEEPL